MIKKAYLAGGCFWGLEELLRKLTGVSYATAGYTDGMPPWVTTLEPFNHRDKIKSTLKKYNWHLYLKNAVTVN